MRVEKYIVDRIEEGIIVMNHAETEKVLEIEKSFFDVDFKDGDVVWVSFDSENFVKDIEKDIVETRNRKRTIKKKLRSLFDN